MERFETELGAEIPLGYITAQVDGKMATIAFTAEAAAIVMDEIEGPELPEYSDLRWPEWFTRMHMGCWQIGED